LTTGSSGFDGNHYLYKIILHGGMMTVDRYRTTQANNGFPDKAGILKKMTPVTFFHENYYILCEFD
jgi:hypothetical protein